DGLTVAKVPDGIDGSALLSKLEKQYGLKLAGGQDNLKGKIIRLAHMGHIDQFDVLAALAGVELVLKEMGHKVEPGKGVAAAKRRPPGGSHASRPDQRQAGSAGPRPAAAGRHRTGRARRPQGRRPQGGRPRRR